MRGRNLKITSQNSYCVGLLWDYLYCMAFKMVMAHVFACSWDKNYIFGHTLCITQCFSWIHRYLSQNYFLNEFYIQKCRNVPKANLLKWLHFFKCDYLPTIAYAYLITSAVLPWILTRSSKQSWVKSGQLYLDWGTSWEKPGAEVIASQQMTLFMENNYTA